MFNFANIYLKVIDTALIEKLKTARQLDNFLQTLEVSPYIASVLVKNQEWIEEFFIDRSFYVPFDRYSFLKTASSLFSFEQFVELWKKEHVKIGIRQILKVADVTSILEELSLLADTIIEILAHRLFTELEKEFGVRCEHRFCVIALGKLGGEELNYYSDIDLMYLYDKNSSKLKEKLTVNEFFFKFFSELTKRLSSYTPSGKMYNVDLRLRPHGRKGLIAMPLEAYELYYQSFGRTWERAMLIKARRSCGDDGLFEEFQSMITPFVYRKYLDYGAIQELKNLKSMIEQHEKSDALNIKTGEGGIREIEFIVQSIQLVFGGKEPWIRERNTVKALHKIYTKGLLGVKEYEKLLRAYLFYRELENFIQMLHCTQTHTLPKNSDDMVRICKAMGFKREDDLLGVIEYHQKNVRSIFSEVLANIKEVSEDIKEYVKIKSKDFGRQRREIEKYCQILIDGKPSSPVPESLREKAAEAVKKILSEIGEVPDPVMCLRNLNDFMEVMRYSKGIFYNLLCEKEGFRKIILQVFGSSQFLSRILLMYPELLDSFFEEDLISRTFSQSELISNIIEATRDLSYEDKLNYLRKFKQEYTLRIGIGDLSRVFLPYRVFHEWTKLADTVIIVLYEWLRFLLKRKIAIIALGKLGGREITYHSDLDIVFVGEAPQFEYVDFYTRFINALTLQSSFGVLFEVDTRLRPFGTGGVMVNTPSDLRRYFSKYARTWERLSYSKARVVVADDASFLVDVMDAIEDFVYCSPLEGIEEDIVEIRSKLESELGRNHFNIKYSKGGLSDVEFIAQYLNIRYGLYKTSTLSALCKAYRKGKLSKEDYMNLKNNYLFLRSVENALRLAFYPPLKDLPEDERRLRIVGGILRIEPYILKERFLQVKEENRKLFRKILG